MQQIQFPMAAKTARENPFISIACNIVLPVVVLQQVSSRLGDRGPLIALGVALALPLGYAVWDYRTRRHKSYVALLGIINVLFTGGFALMRLSPFWFAVKEAAFPLIIGMGVALSAFSKRPLMRMLFVNEQVMAVDKLNTALATNRTEIQFDRLIRKATLLFTLSFVFSTLVNFILARRIFTEINTHLPESVQAEQLNAQIAQMTSYGYVAITLPMMLFMAVLLFWFIRNMCRLSGLPFDELMKT